MQGRWAGVALLAGVLLIGACTAPTTSTASPPSGSTRTTSDAPLSAPDLAEAMSFRRQLGLRWDEAWVRQLAADPAARDRASLYDTPVTAAESAELEARVRNKDAIAAVIERYGSAQPEWAGLFIDQLAEGAVVALFTGRLDDHAARIGRLVGPVARWDIRPARWTFGQLLAFRARVDEDQAWLRTIDAWWMGSGIATSENAVRLHISSADPKAPALVLEHFGGEGWLRAESDGVGQWQGPRGTLVVMAVTPDGRPVPDLLCVPLPDELAAYRGDDAYATGDDGRCVITHAGATSYTVELRRDVSGSADWVVVGRGRVDVPPNSEGRVRIVVND